MVFQHFMEPEGLLWCSEEPSAGPCPESDWSIPLHLISLRSILIFFSHICLGLPSGHLPSAFPTRILYAFLFSTCAVCSPSHPCLDYSNYTRQRVSVMKLIMQFSRISITSPFFGPNILNTLSLWSFHNIRDQVSRPYRTIGKIIFLYILIFTFLDSRGEDRRLWTEWHQALVNSVYSCFPPEQNFDLLLLFSRRAHSSVDGWGAMLQSRRLWVWVLMTSLNFFNLPKPSSSTVAMGFTQPLTEMSARRYIWG
jgi:hypothetical protein